MTAVKSGLILLLSVAGSLLFLNSVTGQMRPPGTITGRPPGSITGGMAGRPPGFTGGVTGGVTGMRPGVTGGVTGALGGTTNIGGATGSLSGMRPGTLTGGIGGGVEWVYTCTVCGKEVM